MSVCVLFQVGVRLDEPVGRSDGTVKGKKYFDAMAGYGSFVRPFNVTVGDFPEADLFGEEEEEEKGEAPCECAHPKAAEEDDEL